MRGRLPHPTPGRPAALARSSEGTPSPGPDNPGSSHHPPMITVGAPGPITDPPAPVGSPTRAAGTPPSKTAVDPMTTASTPQLLPTQAEGSPPIRTVGAAGVAIGTGAPWVALLTIMSVTRAARDITDPPAPAVPSPPSCC